MTITSKCVARCQRLGAVALAMALMAACSGALEGGQDAGVPGADGASDASTAPDGARDLPATRDSGVDAPAAHDSTVDALAHDSGMADGAPDATLPTGAYRAFTAASYWNRPMPANAPVDPNSSTYIADALNTSVSSAFLRLTGAPDHSSGQAWAYPIYWAKPSDPSYSITPAMWGPTVSMRIPYGATPQSGSDGAIVVYDLAADRVFELWQASYNSSADSWSASSTKRWVLSSNGLDGNAAGSNNPLNTGHRGLPSSVRAIRVDEVQAGVIEHRLECFWHATGRPDSSTPWYYWPMVGYESGKGGIVPEGIVLRIKSSVNLSQKALSTGALVIATAMQQYGCVVGDNDGGTNNSLKLERDLAGWTALDPSLSVNSLSVLTWSDYEFVKGGYDPP